MGGQANYNRWDGVVVILVRTTHKWLANTLAAAPLKTDAHPYQLGKKTLPAFGQHVQHCLPTKSQFMLLSRKAH